jgi:hypothetical protein
MLRATIDFVLAQQTQMLFLEKNILIVVAQYAAP